MKEGPVRVKETSENGIPNEATKYRTNRTYHNEKKKTKGDFY